MPVVCCARASLLGQVDDLDDISNLEKYVNESMTLIVFLSGAVDDSPPPAIETLDDREGVQRSNSYSNSGSPVAKHALTLQHSLSETALLEVASPGDIRPCDRHRHE